MIVEVKSPTADESTEEIAAVVVRVHRSAADVVQWPIARVAVRGVDVQCYHSGAFIGFEIDGRHCLIPLIPIVEQLVPTRIGTFPAPAEASTDVGANHQQED